MEGRVRRAPLSLGRLARGLEQRQGLLPGLQLVLPLVQAALPGVLLAAAPLHGLQRQGEANESAEDEERSAKEHGKLDGDSWVVSSLDGRAELLRLQRSSVKERPVQVVRRSATRRCQSDSGEVGHVVLLQPGLRLLIRSTTQGQPAAKPAKNLPNLLWLSNQRHT